MAPRLVLAVAADREVTGVREPSQKRENVSGRWPGHFSSIPPPKAGPALPAQLAPSGVGQQLGTGSQLREPHVIVVSSGVFGLGHSTRRPAHGPEARPLSRCAVRAEPYHANRHSGGTSIAIGFQMRELPVSGVVSAHDDLLRWTSSPAVAHPLDRRPEPYQLPPAYYVTAQARPGRYPL
jgi:hypothetical protein